MPSRPPVHGERGESTGSVTRAPTDPHGGPSGPAVPGPMRERDERNHVRKDPMADTSNYQLDSDRPPPRTSTRPLSMGISFGIGLTLMLVTGASAQVPEGRGPDTASRVQPSRAERCRVLSSAFIARAKRQFPRDYALRRVDAFYSPVVDACIHAEIAEVGAYATVRDLSHTFLRGNLGEDELSSCLRGESESPKWLCDSLMRESTNLESHYLLYCGAAGVNSVLVDSVRKHQGMVDSVRYDHWMDDGFGGPPVPFQHFAKPATKEQCALLYNRWIGYLRRGPGSSR